MPIPTRPALGGGGSFFSDFEKAWELYPKKEAQGLARSAWQHLVRQEQLPPLAEIEASIRRFMASESWQREEGRFVPQMHNWLRGQRWLDAPKVSVSQEFVEKQQAASAQHTVQEKDARKAAQSAAQEALRPLFEDFADRFHKQAKPWHIPMAFGLWAYLHGKHKTPAPADVPDDNRLGIIEFLQAFKRRCEEAAWRTPSAQERAAHVMVGAFTAPHSPLSGGEPHTFVFARQPARQALAGASMTTRNLGGLL